MTDYYLNGSNIITMITNSVMDPENPKRLDFYYDEQGTLLGFRYNGQDYWYVQNGQGDIAGILDSTGTQVVSYTYDSWGVPISVTGSMADTIGEINPFRYRGYYYDSETGLYYLNSRYYDPVIGRFVNTDGLVVAGDGMLSSNMYLYCQNNPICCVDPTGALGSFFDFPLSMADRMQMSQSMLDSYNAAKRSYYQNQSATAPSIPNNIEFGTPLHGEPNSTIRIPSEKGDNDIDRHFDSEGKAEYDVHYGHPHHHRGIGSPHRHNWSWDENGNATLGPAIPCPPPAKSATIPEKILAGAIVLGSAAAIIWIVSNDISDVGVIDDFLLGPLSGGFVEGLSRIFA